MMNCETYRKLYPKFTDFPVPKEVWDTPECDDWNEHLHHCPSCSDWAMHQELAQRGVSADNFPCVHMAYYASHQCDEHPDPRECTKSVVLHIPKFDEYVISPRGSTGDDITITHCPWCGITLPESRRDEWFDKLESLGIDPWEEDIPEEYQSDKWHRKPNQ